MENDKIFTNDLDEIQLKKQLIEEVRSIDENQNFNDIEKKILDLRKKWKRIYNNESIYEEQLEQEFEQLIDNFYSKRNEIFKQNQLAKQEIINEANKLAVSKNLKEATEKMNELFEKWKQVGYAGKDIDDNLWENFKKAKQALYDNKKENWQQIQDKLAKALEVKKEIIEKVREVKDSTEWKKTTDKLNELFDEWKKAGFAGKEVDDNLWEEFNGLRQQFYANKQNYYDQLHEKQAASLNIKNELIEKAREIANTKDYSRENTQKMKELGIEWKNAGSCGKTKDDEVWAIFTSIMDDYFHGLDELNKQKHQQWVQNLQKVINNKKELIAKQKKQIEWMQSEIKTIPSERRIAEMKLDIEDKEAFIAELEAQIEDIKATLEKGK